LHPLEKRRLCTAHARSGRWSAPSNSPESGRLLEHRGVMLMPEMVTKRVQLLQQVAPGILRIVSDEFLQSAECMNAGRRHRAPLEHLA
jgi:hypothetical protein